MRKGSITIFFSMILLLMANLFFSMAETVRIQAMRQNSQSLARQAMASSFSEYQPFLWEKYGILALDISYGRTSYGTENVREKLYRYSQKTSRKQKKGEVDFLQVDMADVALEGYQLLTDEQAACFVKQGADRAKKNLGEKAGEKLLASMVEMKQLETGDMTVTEQVEAAEYAMEHPESVAEKVEKQQISEEQGVPNTYDNPFDIFHQIKEDGWLGLVTTGDVSTKAMDETILLSHRKKQEGQQTKEKRIRASAQDYMWYTSYLVDTFGYYGRIKENQSLDYQMEYILEGKGTDRENLEQVVEKLIGIRQANNMVTIMQSPKMLGESYQLALAIAGVSVNPAIVKMVQMGIVSVWALMESILDVRELLKGGKVPFMKTPQQWKSQVCSLGQVLEQTSQETSYEQGVTYQQYLIALTMLLSEEKKGLRPLDVMEAELMQQEDYVNCKMDHMICCMDTSFCFQGAPLFFSFISMANMQSDWYDYEVKEAISYL